MNGQIYKLHRADIAVGGTGNFTTTLTTPNGNRQYTTDSAGFLGSLREHPVAWAGVELNYGYTHLSERYVYPGAVGGIFHESIPAGVHEATGAYMFHPHFLHLQPFLNIGGGGLYFNGVPNTSQWRTTGLIETGFDVPTKNKHIGFRVQGRTLVYRAPNFGTSGIASRSWVATTQPSVSVYYRF